jgi:hypothetical protein
VKRLIYIEENFLDAVACKSFIDFAIENKDKELPYGNESRGGDTFITNLDCGGNLYQGGVPDCIDLNGVKNPIISSITKICKSFDENIKLDYATIVRWTEGTFMKPHYDNSYQDNPDVFAALVYLNDSYSGGYTCFEDFEVKPQLGKLVIFSNSQYLHHVTKVEDSERFVLSLWYSGLTRTLDRAMIHG